MVPTLFSVSYAGLWGQVRLDLHEFIQKAAALGYNAVELMGKRPHLSILDTSPEDLTALRETAESAGVEIATIAGYTDFTASKSAAEVPFVEMQVAYVRSIGPYNTIGTAFETLCKWAGPRGLLGKPDVKFLGVYNDDPQVTDPDKLRAEACVTVPDGTAGEGEVGTMAIPGGRFAVARFEIDPQGFTEAWNQLMGEWLPESGYEPDDRLCYELYHNDPKDHPEGHFVLDLVQPVRPMR